MNVSMDSASKLYHRAIWALDSRGYDGRNEQYWLMQRWQHCSRLSAIDGGDPEFFSGEVEALIQQSERAIKAAELDHNCKDWERQRNYLGSIINRCLLAANVQHPPKLTHSKLKKVRDVFYSVFSATTPTARLLSAQEKMFIADLCAKLHYYNPGAEDFHADLGFGYYIWQGIRAELKMGITLANISPETHADVIELADGMRIVIGALEFGDHTRLHYYDRSQLNLSEEQHRKQLWEGVVNELKWLMREHVGGMKARLLA